MKLFTLALVALVAGCASSAPQLFGCEIIVYRWSDPSSFVKFPELTGSVLLDAETERLLISLLPSHTEILGPDIESLPPDIGRACWYTRQGKLILSESFLDHEFELIDGRWKYVDTLPIVSESQ